jgi:hypothetical protein
MTLVLHDIGTEMCCQHRIPSTTIQYIHHDVVFRKQLVAVSQRFFHQANIDDGLSRCSILFDLPRGIP